MPKRAVFITHSRTETVWKDRVVACLGSHDITVWDDGDGSIGEDALRQLKIAMETAGAAIFLVSEDFLDSPLICEVEIPYLCRLRDDGRLEIFPVLVGPCVWQEVPWLDGLEMRSLEGEPLTSGDDHQVGEVLAALTRDVGRHLEAEEPAPFTEISEQRHMSRDERFSKLFHEYYRPICYFFAARGIAKEECRDLTQETFSKAYKGIEGYREEATYKTWLFKIAKHLWLNHQRKSETVKRNRPEVSLDCTDENHAASDPPDTESLGPEERLLQAERVKLVRDALAKLPPQRRRCLILRLEGLKYRDIAVLLDISLQSVRSHLSQAREQLRGLVGDYFSDGDFSAGEGADDE